MINHTYGVAEESGTWYVVIDGDIARNVPYRTANAARSVAEKLRNTSNLWEKIFAIETRIAEAFKDTPWPYGATCVNHGTDTEPSWLLTEPYRTDDEAVRIINPDPTGYIQINVYTRDLYETACRIAEVKPDTDELIKDEFGDCGHGKYVSEDIEPAEAVKMRLDYRRSVGIHIEEIIEQNERAEALKAAGLMLDHFTRDQYETACQMMGVPALEDDQVMVVVTLDVVNGLGIGFISPGITHDPITINLAYRRAMGLGRDKREETTDPGDSK